MRYAAWAFVGLLIVSGCASPTVRYHAETPKQEMVVVGAPGSDERKVAFVKQYYREKYADDLTDAQALYIARLMDRKIAGKLTDAQIDALLAPVAPYPDIAPMPYSSTQYPIQFYNFPRGQHLTCQNIGMMTNCY